MWPDKWRTSTFHNHWALCHYSDAIMTTIASQITSLTIVYSIVYSDADRKHQSSTSLAFVRGIHRWPVNSPHKMPVTRKMFPFDDVIMVTKMSKGPLKTEFECHVNVGPTLQSLSVFWHFITAAFVFCLVLRLEYCRQIYEKQTNKQKTQQYIYWYTEHRLSTSKIQFIP